MFEHLFQRDHLLIVYKVEGYIPEFRGLPFMNLGGAARPATKFCHKAFQLREGHVVYVDD